MHRPYYYVTYLMKTSIAVLLTCCGIGLTISACTYTTTKDYKENNNSHILNVSAENTEETYYKYTFNENYTPQKFANVIEQYYNLQTTTTQTDSISFENAKIKRNLQQGTFEYPINTIEIEIKYIIQGQMPDIVGGATYTTNNYQIWVNSGLVNPNKIELLEYGKTYNVSQESQYIQNNESIEFYNTTNTTITTTTNLSNFLTDFLFTKTILEETINANLENENTYLKEVIETKNDTISSQNSQIANLQTEINNNESTITNLQQQITNLQGLIDLGGNNGIIDLRGMMLDILAMPWAFISNAFNVTLWENTPYQINFSNIFMGFIAIMTLLFIVKLFTNGFNALGTITNSTSETRLNNARAKESMSKARLNDRTDPNNKTTTINKDTNE